MSYLACAWLFILLCNVSEGLIGVGFLACLQGCVVIIILFQFTPIFKRFFPVVFEVSLRDSGLAFLAASLLYGVGVMSLDFSSERLVIYIYAHMVCVVALYMGGKALGSDLNVNLLLARLVACSSLIGVGLLNTGSIPVNQRSIALIELSGGLGLWFSLGLHCRRLSLWLLWPVAIFIVTVISNSSLSEGWVLDGYWRSAGILLHVFLGFVFYLWFVRDSKALYWFVFTVFSLMMFYCLYYVLFWFYLPSPRTYNWFNASPFFRNIRHLGYMLCVGGVILLWAVLALGGWQRVVAWCGFVLTTSLLLWSGSRAGFLCAVFAGAGYFWMVSLSEKPKVWVGIILGFMLSLFLSSLFVTELTSLGWISALVRSSDAATIDAFSSSRVEIWVSLFGPIIDKPWFGWGGEAFRMLRPDTWLVQAHNALIQLLIEWGGVGAFTIGVPIAGIWLSGLRTYISVKEDTFERRWLGLGVVAVLAMVLFSMIDGIFYHATPSAFLAVCIALLASGVVRQISPQKCDY